MCVDLEIDVLEIMHIYKYMCKICVGTNGVC